MITAAVSVVIPTYREHEGIQRVLDRLLEENHRRAALQSGEPPLVDSKDSDDE